MLYYENLEDIIFTKHQLIDHPDELVIISGYIGPTPVQRLKELPLKTTVIGGMYPRGVNLNLFNSLSKINEENPDLNLLFSTLEVHSKIYLWKKNNKIISALIGSANFSRNGLCTNFRESLADVTSDTFYHLNKYLELIVANSTKKPLISDKSCVVEYKYKQQDEAVLRLDHSLKYQYDIPLFGYKGGKRLVFEKSGLNWGFSNGHVALGDAYIPISKELLKENPNLIPAYDKTYVSLTKKKRNSDPIEIIWDDNTVMEASLEGSQILDGVEYPKQIASYSKSPVIFEGEAVSAKSILGRYLRKRLGVRLDEMITIDTLEKYGRLTITLALIEEGVYYADFSI